MKRITDWCQVLGAITTAVGVWFAYSALQKTVQWNKLSGQYTFFSTQVLTEKEMAAANALERAGWNLHTQLTPLPDNIVATVLTNSTIFAPVKAYMNFLEDYSLAVRSGVLDKDSAFALMGDKLTYTFEVFFPLVKELRFRRKSNTILIEWERLVMDDWKPKVTKMNAPPPPPPVTRYN